LSVLDPSQTGIAQLVYSSFLGGTSGESGYGITLDTSRNVYVTGFTVSNDFPTTDNAYQRNFPGGFFKAFYLNLVQSRQTLRLKDFTRHIWVGVVMTVPRLLRWITTIMLILLGKPKVQVSRLLPLLINSVFVQLLAALMPLLPRSILP